MASFGLLIGINNCNNVMSQVFGSKREINLVRAHSKDTPESCYFWELASMEGVLPWIFGCCLIASIVNIWDTEQWFWAPLSPKKILVQERLRKKEEEKRRENEVSWTNRFFCPGVLVHVQWAMSSSKTVLCLEKVLLILVGPYEI